MKCKKCGAEIPDNHNYCNKCATQIANRNGKKDTIIGIIGLVFIIAFIVLIFKGCAWMFSSHSAANSAEMQQTLNIAQKKIENGQPLTDEEQSEWNDYQKWLTSSEAQSITDSYKNQ